jgi:hypothetical protein
MLTVGLSSCLLIALYIRHELSYDRFQEKGGRVARVIMEYRFAGGGEAQRGNYTSTKVAPTFQRVFPEVEAAVRMRDADRVVGYGEQLFKETRFMYADSSYFRVFGPGLLKGDARTALSGPLRLVLTVSTARRYFGEGDPMGKLLRVGTDSVNYLVTGVIPDCPSNSQIKFDFLASFSSLYANQEDTYWDANYTTYLLLRDAAALAPLQGKIGAFMTREMAGKGAMVNFYLEPFLRIHLHSEYGGFEPNTSITYIYILAGVALLILLIACSTCINLSTARSMERAREVGVRKVIGAGRGQLFRQFIGESLVLCLFAALLSLVVVALVLPAFNRLADRTLPLSALFSLPFLGLTLLIAVIVGAVAGGYPALVLAGFQPVPENQQLAVTANPIDEDFVKTVGLQLVAGEDLVEQDIWDAHPEDFPERVRRTGVGGAGVAEPGRAPGGKGAPAVRRIAEPVYRFLLNESAARELGWSPQEAVGKRMFLDASRPGFVKGVVKDFHFQSLHYAIRPLVLFPAMRADNLLLTANFIRLAGIAILIAVPLAWWAMTRWLQDFIYREEMDWRVYLVAGLVVLVIASGTVSIQAVKTARLNPVKNLKVE